MKKLILFLFLIFTSSIVLSQTKSLVILDIKTKKVIPFVNVVLKNTNLGWSGNEEGEVRIKFNSLHLSDSLIFSAVGYERKTIEYSKVHSVSQILLMPSSTTLKEVKIKAQRYKRARLGRKKRDRSDYSGYGLVNNKSKYYSKNIEAKYIPNDIGADGIINEIRVYIRFASDFPFEVNVLSVNEIDGFPSKRLLKKPLRCKSKKDNKWMTIKLKKYDLRIPKNGFFIAINWNVDSVINSPIQYDTYKMYYVDEKKARIDTFFYRGTVIGANYEKENNLWRYNDTVWWNTWQSSINFRDTCKQCLIDNPDFKKWDMRTSYKSTLAVYANVLYSKSAKKYEENILDKEGIVSDKDQKKIISEKYEYVKKDKLFYQQKDVFQLFESIKRALDSNRINYIAHHLLSFTYESIEGFDLEINERRRKSVVYDIDEILKNKEDLKLTNEGNGFYLFDFRGKIGGKLLLKNGEWRIVVERERQYR